MRVVVIGGGIAGLAVARFLAPRVRHLVLLERERQLCAHSSGRNAAMFRPLEAYGVACRLAEHSATLLDGFFSEGRAAWLAPTGMALTAANVEALAPLAAAAKQHGVRAEWRTGAELARAVPHAPGLAEMVGLLLPDAGVLDIHRITSLLAAQARAHAAEIRVNTQVRQLLSERGRVTGVELDSGQRLAADVVVLAAGPWSAELAARAGAELPLSNYRRHLVQLHLETPQRLAEPPPLAGLQRLAQPSQLAATRPLDEPGVCPIVWHLEPEVYFRVERTGILASPCDRQRVVAGALTPDSEALCELARRLAPFGAPLSHAQVQTAWACVRCLSPDGRAVLGPEPRLPGLFWLSALAGHGMTIGVGAGAWLSRMILEEDVSGAEEVAPGRWLQPNTRSLVAHDGG